MNILLIGATGVIGSRILSEAVARGHEVIAASRKGDAPEGTPLSLEASDAAAVAEAADGAEVIVAAASPRSSGDAEAEMAEIGAGILGGAEASGARLIVVGGAGTLNLPDGRPVLSVLPPEILPEATGMRDFRGKLADSAADWTFFAPAAQIAPGERTGSFRLGSTTLVSDAEGESRISAEDYAVALLDEIEAPAHRRAVFTVAY
ncbi:NAD(P)H-binding protein [Rhodobacterales bacterium HKCCE2091]|nr:NAD(P)H-binding protein [Rhodobacterales bacterium HKCCE2091]